MQEQDAGRLRRSTAGNDARRGMIEKMRMEKKRILKEDGRYLVYYHFPDSASPEETQVYAEIDPAAAEAGHSADVTATKTVEEQAHV